MELDNFIDGCIAVEETVASIYRTFMDLFPDEKAFWEDLQVDELEHSFWLSDLNNAESIDLLPSEDMLPSMELINKTLVFVKRKKSQIRLNPLTFEKALEIAHQIEELMVETFANEFTANLISPDYNSLTNKLIAAEKLHVNKIEDMMISKGFMQLS